jgi:serine/threonine-protein kinase OSR1/STK39
VAHILRYKYPEGLSEVVIATIMRKVLEALAYVHKQGDIHRYVLQQLQQFACTHA